MKSTLILGLVGLASAGTAATGRHKSNHAAAPFQRRDMAAIPQLLDTRQGVTGGDLCLDDELVCDEFYCVPEDDICCGDGDGAYCYAGTYCMELGCCLEGEICDSVGGCFDDEVECGDYCIPAGGDCCDSFLGAYCDPGDTCFADGTCRPSDGSGDEDDDVPPVSDDGDEETATYSLGPVTTADSEETATAEPEATSTEDDDETTTTEEPTAEETSADETETTASPSASAASGNDGDDDNNNSGGSNSNDDNTDAGSIMVPSLLVGLVAAVPLFL